MAIVQKDKAAEKPKVPAAKLNETVAAKYSTRLTGFQNQVFVEPKTNIRFNLETVTIEQVKRMIAKGSEDFTPKGKEEAAVEPRKK